MLATSSATVGGVVDRDAGAACCAEVATAKRSVGVTALPNSYLKFDVYYLVGALIR